MKNALLLASCFLLLLPPAAAASNAKKKTLANKVVLHDESYMAVLVIKQVYDGRCAFHVQLVGHQDPQVHKKRDPHSFLIDDEDGFTIHREKWVDPTYAKWISSDISPEKCGAFIDAASHFSFGPEGG